jgi:hypothetical protein
LRDVQFQRPGVGAPPGPAAPVPAVPGPVPTAPLLAPLDPLNPPPARSIPLVLEPFSAPAPVRFIPPPFSRSTDGRVRCSSVPAAAEVASDAQPVSAYEPIDNTPVIARAIAFRMGTFRWVTSLYVSEWILGYWFSRAKYSASKSASFCLLESYCDCKSRPRLGSRASEVSPNFS